LRGRANKDTDFVQKDAIVGPINEPLTDRRQFVLLATTKKNLWRRAVKK